MSFKAGDKVVCVRGVGASLRKGAEYTIEHVDLTFAYLVGVAGGWAPTRFELVKRDDPVNHPPHYTSHPGGVECIEITEWLGFNLGNAFKYLFRRNEKGALKENLEKAVWYLEREKARKVRYWVQAETEAEARKVLEDVREKCTRVVGHEPTFIGEAMSYIVEGAWEWGPDGGHPDIDKALSYVRAEIRRVCK